MHQNRLAKLLSEKKPAVGAWLTLADPSIAIILAHAGFDWVMVDNEHNPFTETQVQGFIHALRGTDVSCIVRVRGNDPSHIKWVLDAGADGIIVPWLENAGDARRAVDAAKYHPLGKRGYGALRATDFWEHKQEYDNHANQQVLLICQIERISAVKDIDEIAQMPGIDALWIGPTDLAQSMGLVAEPNHPEVKDCIARIMAAANKHGKAWGIPVGSVAEFMWYVEQGGTLMTVGSSSSMLMNSSKKCVEASLSALVKAGLRKA